MSGPKFQVFISSTYEDLRAERDEVIRAVLEMGHIPVGMEMFSAADEEQWQIIARNIEESDYYAVIAAHRYGSTTPEGISYTRKEYEYAIEKGVPCLGFIIDDKASWAADRFDTGSSKQLLDSFKALIREKPVSFWSTAKELHGNFSIALMKAITARPREGWVRASSVAGPEITGEVIRLSSENAALRRELEQAEAAAGENRRANVRSTIELLRGSERALSYRYERTGEWQKGSTTLFGVFDWLAPELLIENTVEYCASILAMNIREDDKKSWEFVAHNQVKRVLADLMTLDLAEPSTRRHPVSDNSEYWSLTAFGLEVFKFVRKTSIGREVPNIEPEDSEDSVSDVSEIQRAEGAAMPRS